MHKLIVLTIAILFCAPVAQAQAQQPCKPPAPLVVSRERNIFTDEQESDLGDAVAERIQRYYRGIDDDQVTGYLNRIGQRIIKHLPPTSMRFQFFLVDMPEDNAFVLPGGRVYVSRKLVSLAQSEDEVAGVIGHEIGHVLAHQGAIRTTRQLREVLGITEVKDRRDIFEKYNLLMDNFARKPKAFKYDFDQAEKNQIVADQIGLFAVASAGYDPEGLARYFDRVAETKGNTGNFFTDLFGTTKPEAKRLREMLKGVASLPQSCVEARGATPFEEFKKWQASVINYTGSGRKESLHSVARKIPLDPPLRGEVNHLRFSPDGKVVLAQDDSGINVLSHEPFALLFRIEALEAKPAQFTADSRDIIFYNSALHVEQWSIADQKLKNAYELSMGEQDVEVTSRGFYMGRGCIQTQLSPDGKLMACLDSHLNLDLIDVASGAQVFQKKSFYQFDDPEIVMVKQQLWALNSDDTADDDFDWTNMSFSPDSRYFVAGSRNLRHSITRSLTGENRALAVDLTTREEISLRGPIKSLLCGSFAFTGPDRLIGYDRDDPKSSPVVSFPGGEILARVPLGPGRLTAPTRGNYLLVRPVVNYAVGVMDLSTQKLFMSNKQSAFDIYDQEFVSERINGELGLYGVAKSDLRTKVILPRNMFGRLHAAAVSADMKWLAVSERRRGAVWDLTKGARLYHVRGFRGGYFADDGSMYADFPKFEQTDRTVARLDLTRSDIAAGSAINEERAAQFGPFIFVTKPAKKDGGYQQNVILEVRDVRSFSLLWSKPFPKETPRRWMDSQGKTIVLLWPVSSEAAKAEIKGDAALSKQLAAMNEKEGDYFLQVLDARAGTTVGRLLIETGKGSFRISRVIVDGDWVAVCDTQNRVLIYSLSSGEQKGKVFGNDAIINPSGKLLCVENEDGKLTIYDLVSMQKRDQFVFSNSIAVARFTPEGKSLFVLTANQTAYFLDVSALIR